MLRFKVYYQWRRHNWSCTNFYSLISLANILLTTSLLRKPALLSAMLWFAGLLLGPVTYPLFIPLASQCVWELQYVTKDINSTLLLYFKHSPFLGKPVTFTSHQEAPIQESAEEKKRRRGKKPLLFAMKGREQGGATLRAPCGLSLPWSFPWLGWVGKPRRMLLLGTVNHCTCAQAVHTSASWPASLTCPSTLAKTHTPKEAQEVSTMFEAPFPLSMILHVCKLTWSSFFS